MEYIIPFYTISLIRYQFLPERVEYNRALQDKIRKEQNEL